MFVGGVKLGEIDGRVCDPIHADSAFLERRTSGCSFSGPCGLPAQQKKKEKKYKHNSVLLFFHLEGITSEGTLWKGEVVAMADERSEPNAG